MELMVVLFVIYVIGPLGLLFIVMAGLGQRDIRPIRGKAMIGLLIWALLIIGIASFAPYQFAPFLEIGLVSVILGIVLVGISLFIPPAPDKTRASIFGVVGLICVALAAASLWSISQVNFGL